MSPAQKRRVLDACFEVVVPKPTEDPLEYERKLPWDQVPFHVRNDPYHSIGTAFAVSNRELVTAFHVLDLHQRSATYPRLFIRDRAQRVFEVDQILACDQARDYVRFTVKDRTFEVWLEVRDRFELNQVVYTAGNALGEGIVIRKGELIGTTPEPIAGAWNLLRSSADVNGGNSGGPLLDVRGRVLGVVVARKDNISLSLPMAEAQATGKARFFRRMTYGFALFPDRSEPVDEAYALDLPQPYAAVRLEAERRNLESYRIQMDRLFEQQSSDLFPVGPHAREVLYDIPTSARPEVVFKNSNNGLWTFSNLEAKRFDLPGDGKFFLAMADGTVFSRMDLPKEVSQAAVVEDPKQLMDLLLKGLRLTRTVGSEEVRITSFGKPFRSFPHRDRYGRPWTFHLWALPHQDQFVIVPTLTIPGGFVFLLRQVETAQLEPWLYDLKKMLDFTVVPYGGRLKAWRDFLALPHVRPAFLESMTLNYEVDRTLRLKTPWIQLDLDAKDLDIEDDSLLVLCLGFQPSDGGRDLVLRKLLIEDADGNNYISILRYFKPEDGLAESYFKNWRDVVRGRHPYTQEAFSDEGSTVIATVLPNPGGEPASEGSKDLHTLYLNRTGSVEPRAMKARLNRLVEHVRPAGVPATSSLQRAQR